ncbi:DUF3267 domain-containing protein [Texcoconibacillus texcoconensis]|uniref:Zincin peptidase n=1 Tax=Texcoconibacillus texcoconensis TaxID=1095777 RepID=A0A840QPG8_9BACI|nr:DUF3267 domain-containing protein [Texcoconibacillus texcoconensis]MBB5173238.1 hypothetical protein [Texcoconibacillus texcoconensis]
MNCYQTVDILNRTGKQRLLFLSFLIACLFFIFYFMIFRTFFSQEVLVDYGFFSMVISLVLIIPIHQLFHCIPVWVMGKKAKIGFILQRYPRMYCMIKEVTPKSLTVVSICSPAFFMTGMAIIASLQYPQFLHYFALMASFNIGICVYDFMYLQPILKAPRKCWIEDKGGSFHILSVNQVG